jgi:hypothetical protein
VDLADEARLSIDLTLTKLNPSIDFPLMANILSPTLILPSLASIDPPSIFLTTI